MNKAIFKHILMPDITVKDLLKPFKEINKDLEKLQECLNRDFSLLRSIFKENHQKASTIEENAKEIFDLFNKNKIKNDFNVELESFYQHLETYNSNLSILFKPVKSFFEELLRNLELINVPIKNLKDNANSFDYIFHDNECLSILYENNKENIRKHKNNYNKLKELLPEFEEAIRALSKKANAAKKEIWHIEETHVTYTNRLLSKIEATRELISNKNKEAAIHFPKVFNYILDTYDNKDKIITDMQYHDIIRQKIEHIQKVYDEITAEIEDTIKKDHSNNKTKDKSFEYIIKIGEIINIETSQINSANQEYQKAVENLTERLLTIGENTSNISTMCNNFIVFQANKEDSFFHEIDNKLEGSTELKHKLFETNITVDKYLTILNDKINEVVQINNKLHKIINKLAEGKDDFNKSKNNIYDKRGKISKLHIKILLNELVSNNDYLLEMINNILEAKKKTDQVLTASVSEKDFEEQIYKLDNCAKALIMKISNYIEKVNKIKEENSNYGSNVSENILNSIRNISYYEDFDKRISEIIKQQEEMFGEINLDSLENNASISDNIQDYYTMKSERDIHKEALAKVKKAEEENAEVFNQAGDEEDNDDANIELF